MKRKVIGFHTDENGDWVAALECGHRQHVRHNPPFENRPWVLYEAGRRSRIGQMLDCLHCDQAEPPPEPEVDQGVVGFNSAGGDGPCSVQASWERDMETGTVTETSRSEVCQEIDIPEEQP